MGTDSRFILGIYRKGKKKPYEFVCRSLLEAMQKFIRHSRDGQDARVIEVVILDWAESFCTAKVGGIDMRLSRAEARKFLDDGGAGAGG